MQLPFHLREPVRSHERAWASIAAFAVLWLALALLSPARADDREVQPVALRLTYEGTVDEIIVGRFVDDNIFVPLEDVLAHLKIFFQRDKDAHVFRGYFVEHSKPFLLNFDAGRYEYERSGSPIGTDAYLVDEGRVFVLPALIEEVFDIRLTVDTTKLHIRVFSDTLLPVELARKREALRSSAIDPFRKYRHGPLLPSGPRPWLAGWYTDYNVHSRQSAYGTSFGYNVLFGAEIAGGDLEIGADGSEQARSQQHRFRWRRVWDESKPVRQVIVGRHSTEGLIAAQIDGITITNQRPVPRTLFGRELVQGYAAPGTEVGAYVGGDLVGLAYVEDSGRFGIPVPVSYGSTSIELRYFNRYGLVADEHRFLQVPTTLLPAGESEYTIQVGRRHLSRHVVGQAAYARALAPRVTALFALDYAPTLLEEPAVAHARLSMLAGKGFVVETLAAPGELGRFSVQRHLTNRSSLTADVTTFAGSGRYNMSGARWELRSGYSAILDRYFRATNHVSGSFRHYGDYRSASVTNYATVDFRAFRLTLDVQSRWDERTDGSALRHQIVSPGLSFTLGRPAWMHGIYVRSKWTYDTVRRTGTGFELHLEKRTRRFGRFHLWTRRGPRYGPRVTGLNWTIDLSALRIASVTAAQGAGSYSSQSANGSIVYDSEHGAARFSRLSQVGRSNATFQMFMDTDGNGRRDEGEPELETSGLRLVHANARLRSEHTASTARQLVGYARYTATVDRSRFANPLWIAAVDSFSFVARPNVVSTYEIPVQVGGAIEGRLVAADQAIEPVALDGINLTLTSADNGTARLIQTYSDGVFYEIGLRPGTYTVQIDPSELEGRRLTIVPASHSFRIAHKREGDIVRDLNFSVHFEAVDAGIAAAETVETPVQPDNGPAARPPVFETAATAIGDDSDGIAEGRPPVRHVVDSGESLARIALGHYGDQRYWIRLFRANQDIVADPDVLRTGWKLDVPPDSPLTDEELSDLAYHYRLK